MDKIKDLDGIELLPHPPYSPDLVTPDYLNKYGKLNDVLYIE